MISAFVCFGRLDFMDLVIVGMESALALSVPSESDPDGLFIFATVFCGRDGLGKLVGFDFFGRVDFDFFIDSAFFGRLVWTQSPMDTFYRHWQRLDDGRLISENAPLGLVAFGKRLIKTTVGLEQSLEAIGCSYCASRLWIVDDTGRAKVVHESDSNQNPDCIRRTFSSKLGFLLLVILKRMAKLRCFVDKILKTWEEWLPYIEFAYNKVVNTTTSYYPFELVNGFNPLTPPLP
ncbi:hypothetical protein CR513_08058, partial [Mucuna pruriens]